MGLAAGLRGIADYPKSSHFQHPQEVAHRGYRVGQLALRVSTVLSNLCCLKQSGTPKIIPPLFPTSRDGVWSDFGANQTIFRTCASSLYTSTYGQLIPEFHSSRIVATLGLSLFVVGLGCGPMILSPLSEVRVTNVLTACVCTSCSLLFAKWVI